MAFAMNPGDTKTLAIVFTDTNGVQHPLSAVPTCVDSTGVATISPVGTQTPTDPSYSWTIACPATAASGSALSLVVTGVNPDGTQDVDTYPVAINALDDTLQQATFT